MSTLSILTWLIFFKPISVQYIHIYNRINNFLLSSKYDWPINLVGHSTLVEHSILWNHSRLSDCLSAQLSVHPSISFLKIESSVFSEIVWWLLTMISSNWQSQILRKRFGAQTWDKKAKIKPKIMFFAIFWSLVHTFSFKLHRIIVWNNV